MIYLYFRKDKLNFKSPLKGSENRNSSETAASHRLSHILSHTLIINRKIHVLWCTLYFTWQLQSHHMYLEGKYGWLLSHHVNMSNSKHSDNMITAEDLSLGLIQLSITGSPCVIIGKCFWKYIHILKFHNTNPILPLIPMLQVGMHSYRIFFHPQL
jgi:hypothetical protein